MSDDQLHNNLLGAGKKGSQSYQKKVHQIQTQIQILKNKNNQIQKQSDNDIQDSDIRKQIYQQSQFIENEISKIKKLLEDFASQFKDPTSKNKLKEMWKNASRQIERNKIIMQRIVNQAPRQSFMNRQDRMRSSIQDNRGKNLKIYGRSRQSQELVRQKKIDSKQLQQQQAYDDSQFILQNQIKQQKNEILNHLQQKNQKINEVMNQIAMLVEGQGQDVNIITDNVNQAHQNLVSANQELQQANTQQKKARKKYCWVAVATVVIVGMTLGIFFILSSN